MTSTQAWIPFAVAAAWLSGAGFAAAQPQVPPEGPTVSMNVVGPGGHSDELTTHESGLATLDVNGHQYGFRPTMYDDAGTKMTITIFDMGGPGQAVRELAEVNLTGGGAGVTSKSSPAFTVKAWKGTQKKVQQTTRR